MTRPTARALVALALLFAGCGSLVATPTPHGDPPCAFDGSGCLANRLAVTITVGTDGPQAELVAIAGVSSNSWTQTGVRTQVDWTRADGTRVTSAAGSSPLPVAKPIARSVELTRQAGFEGQLSVTVDLGDQPTTVDLDPTSYSVRVVVTASAGTATFILSVCAGSCWPPPAQFSGCNELTPTLGY